MDFNESDAEILALEPGTALEILAARERHLRELLWPLQKATELYWEADGLPDVTLDRSLVDDAWAHIGPLHRQLAATLRLQAQVYLKLSQGGTVPVRVSSSGSTLEAGDPPIQDVEASAAQAPERAWQFAGSPAHEVPRDLLREFLDERSELLAQLRALGELWSDKACRWDKEGPTIVAEVLHDCRAELDQTLLPYGSDPI